MLINETVSRETSPGNTGFVQKHSEGMFHVKQTFRDGASAYLIVFHVKQKADGNAHAFKRYCMIFYVKYAFASFCAPCFT